MADTATSGASTNDRKNNNQLHPHEERNQEQEEPKESIFSMLLKSSVVGLSRYNGKSSQKTPPPPNCSSPYYIWTARIGFILFLCIVACSLGIAAFQILTKSEMELAQTQYTSIVERALYSSQGMALRIRKGTVTLASIFANLYPNANEDWPNVALNGFEEISKNVGEASNGRGYSFSPILYVDNENNSTANDVVVQEFEDFIYDYYRNHQTPKLSSPETAGMSSFGKGIYGIDRTLNTTDKRYRVPNTGVQTWNSPYSIIAPIVHLQALSGNVESFLLYDHHSVPDRGIVVDNIISCSKERQYVHKDTSLKCTSLSDPLFLLNQPKSAGPAALIMEPIYPANDPYELKGYIASSILWGYTLEYIFAEEVSGIDCILKSETKSFTYRITNGVANYIGEGDLHDIEYDDFAESIVLTGKGLFTNSSAIYTLTIYPTDEYFRVYSTKNPIIATIGAVCIIIFTSFAFYIYDSLVRKEFHNKHIILQAKRQFMRFVSHEVRTPLNSVVMGLKLLEEEVSTLVDYTLTMINNASTSVASLTEDSNHVGTGKNNSNNHGEEVIHDRHKYIIELSNQILGSTENAVAVLSDLLTYDKIEVGEFPLELTIVPIWNLIEKAIFEFKLPYQAKNIKFQLDFHPILALANTKEDHDDTVNENVDEENNLPVIDANHLPVHIQERKVIGDAIRLTQVLRNLLSNGLKFTPEGGNVTVQASWEQSKQQEKDKPIMDNFKLSNTEEKVSFSRCGYLKLSVKDSGAGMTEDQIKGLFRPGVQFNPNELQAGKGSGLGLFIAKGICESHSGSLEAISDGLGKGCTFIVTLPLHYAPEKVSPPVSMKKVNLYDDNGNCSNLDKSSSLTSNTPRYPAQVEDKKQNGIPLNEFQQVSSSTTSVSTTQTRGNSISAPSLRILVVDDAAINRKLLSRLLTRRGHTCEEAENGLEAVDKVKKAIRDDNLYDSILLDYEMPVMNGPSAAKRMRELGCRTFIAGITGNVLPEDVDNFKKFGANSVLAKPVSLVDLEALWVEFGIVTEEDEA